MVVMAMALPMSREGFASGSSTFVMISKGEAPMDCAASTTPLSTSFREDSTSLAMKGAAATTSTTTVAFAPITVPTTACVIGIMATSRIRKGMERRMLMMIPST